MSAGEPVLVLESVSKRFRARGSAELFAVSDVSLAIAPGETYGLVGESGSGKSTLARLVVRLIEPTAGRVIVNGHDISHMSRRVLRPIRRTVQIVVQDPYSSLNPRMSINDVIAEPLRSHGLYRNAGGGKRVAALLDLVGLPASAGRRYPHEFSGGQRQRIGIARALAVNPALIVLDEPVSALDVSIQAQILNLLKRLQRELGLAYLFITHDLSVVRHVASTIGVMYLGRVVESGATEAIFRAPAHPYTCSLLSAIPVADPVGREARRRIVLNGDPPSPFNPPSGCSFRTRCWKAAEMCAAEVPSLVSRAGQTHDSACHFPEPPIDGRAVMPAAHQVQAVARSTQE